MRITVGQLVMTLAGLAIAAALWCFLAPGALGGSTTYLVTRGVSMQPRIHAGELVLLRGGGRYRVGDIVGYRSHRLHVIVLHRIVAMRGDRFVFKGDNNSWLDPEHPAQADLVGRLWVALPGLGGVVKRLHTPLTVAVLAGAAALLLTGGAGGAARRRNRKRRAASADREPVRRGVAPHGPVLPPAAALAGVALLGFSLLGLLAFTRPTARLETSALPYTEVGRFDYSGPARAGAAYPSGRLETGEPVFVQLADRLHLRFDYRLDASAALRIDGTAALRAELTASNGWRRVFELQPAKPFVGNHVQLAGSLGLRSVEALVSRIQATTSVGDATYTLTFAPRIVARGTLDGAPLRTSFAPRFSFAVDPFQLRALPAGDTAPARESFDRSAHGTVEHATGGRNTIALRGLRITVATARPVALIGAALSLCMLLVLGLLMLRAREADEPTRIEARNGHRLVSVARSDRRSYDEVVEVTSFDTLVRLADRYDRMILHEHTQLGHSYRVADEGVLYVYLVPPARRSEGLEAEVGRDVHVA